MASVQDEKDTVTDEVGREIEELSLKPRELMEEQNRVLKIIKVREEEIARLNAVVVELVEKKNREMKAYEEEIVRLNSIMRNMESAFQQERRMINHHCDKTIRGGEETIRQKEETIRQKDETIRKRMR